MIFTWKENVDHNIIFYKLTKAEVYSRHPDMTTLWLAMEDYPGSRWTSPFLLISSLPPLVHATLVKIVIIINFVISAMDGPFYRGWGTGGKGVYLCTPTTEGFRKQIVCTLPYATYCFSMPFHLFPVLGIRSSANMEVVLWYLCSTDLETDICQTGFAGYLRIICFSGGFVSICRISAAVHI